MLRSPAPPRKARCPTLRLAAFSAKPKAESAVCFWKLAAEAPSKTRPLWRRWLRRRHPTARRVPSLCTSCPPQLQRRYCTLKVLLFSNSSLAGSFLRGGVPGDARCLSRGVSDTGAAAFSSRGHAASSDGASCFDNANASLCLGDGRVRVGAGSFSSRCVSRKEACLVCAALTSAPDAESRHGRLLAVPLGVFSLQSDHRRRV